MYPLYKQKQSEPKPGAYQDDPFEEKVLTDFTGGLNITDLAETLPDNQFSGFLNLSLTRQQQLKTRPPYRPKVFGSSVIDTELSDGTDTVSEIIDSVIIRATVSGWSVDGEIHIVAVEDTDGHFSVWAYQPPTAWSAGPYDSGDIVENDGYIYKANTTTSQEPPHADWDAWNTWTQIWNSTTAASVRIIPYQINGAVDVIIFPDDDHPERYSFKTSALSDVGLTIPTMFSKTITAMSKANPCVVTSAAHGLSNGDKLYINNVVDDGPDGDFEALVNDQWITVANVTTDTFTIGIDTSGAVNTYSSGGTVTNGGDTTAGSATAFDRGINYNGTYTYKFAYFYDDENNTTRYGESSLSSTTRSVTVSGLAANEAVQVTLEGITFPSGVSKVMVYRSPSNEASGPFLKIGEMLATETDFIDNIPVGEEGDEALPDETNPSESGNELTIVNPALVGSAIIGFDGSLNNKLIYCNEGYPDVWHPLNFDYLKGNGKGGMEFNRKIYIFTDEAVYQKESISGPAYLISLVGCIDGRSIQNVGQGICWAGIDSVYFADFVQQYGSKGDFPKDIGHPIQADYFRISTTKPIASVFFERRYYLTFYQSSQSTRKTYVWDADFSCWQEHSMQHESFSAGLTQLYSYGKETYEATAKWFCFEHDYYEIITTGDWSDYAGVDWHDYTYLDIANQVYAGSGPITLQLKRDFVRLAGAFQQFVISSGIIYAEGDDIDVDIIFKNEADLEESLNFTASAVATVEYPATFDSNESVFANGEGPETADADEHGFEAVDTASTRQHKKAPRNLKDYSFTIIVNAAESRDFRLSLLAFRYKSLPAPV